MAEKHLITREIGVDMGHRVTHHGSKCRNLHGHRYTVQVTVEGPLFVEGEQQGMVLDYGFLKDIMMKEIDTPCDHGMCLWIEDPFVEKLMGGIMAQFAEEQVKLQGYAEVQIPAPSTNDGGKFYIVPFVPTAENLARHWYKRLAQPILNATQGLGNIASIKVWETPNCSAVYCGGA